MFKKDQQALEKVGSKEFSEKIEEMNVLLENILEFLPRKIASDLKWDIDFSRDSEDDRKIFTLLKALYRYRIYVDVGHEAEFQRLLDMIDQYFLPYLRQNQYTRIGYILPTADDWFFAAAAYLDDGHSDYDDQEFADRTFQQIERSFKSTIFHAIFMSFHKKDDLFVDDAGDQMVSPRMIGELLPYLDSVLRWLDDNESRKRTKEYKFFKAWGMVLTQATMGVIFFIRGYDENAAAENDDIRKYLEAHQEMLDDVFEKQKEFSGLDGTDVLDRAFRHYPEFKNTNWVFKNNNLLSLRGITPIATDLVFRIGERGYDLKDSLFQMIFRWNGHFKRIPVFLKREYSFKREKVLRAVYGFILDYVQSAGSNQNDAMMARETSTEVNHFDFEIEDGTRFRVIVRDVIDAKGANEQMAVKLLTFKDEIGDYLALSGSGRYFSKEVISVEDVQGLRNYSSLRAILKKNQLDDVLVYLTRQMRAQSYMSILEQAKNQDREKRYDPKYSVAHRQEAIVYLQEYLGEDVIERGDFNFLPTDYMFSMVNNLKSKPEKFQKSGIKSVFERMIELNKKNVLSQEIRQFTDGSGTYSLDSAMMVDVIVMMSALFVLADLVRRVGGVDLSTDKADIQIQTSENGFKFPKVDPAMLKMDPAQMVPVILDIKPMPIKDVYLKLGLAVPASDENQDSEFSSEKGIREEQLSAL